MEIDLELGTERLRVELDTAAAPRTTAAILERLPLSLRALHGYATGMAIIAPVEFTLDYVENPHAFGVPAGSVLFFPNLNGRMIDGQLSPNELLVTYGATRFFDWSGWQPCSLIGRVTNVPRRELGPLGAAVRQAGSVPLTITGPLE